MVKSFDPGGNDTSEVTVEITYRKSFNILEKHGLKINHVVLPTSPGEESL